MLSPQGKTTENSFMLYGVTGARGSLSKGNWNKFCGSIRIKKETAGPVGVGNLFKYRKGCKKDVTLTKNKYYSFKHPASTFDAYYFSSDNVLNNSSHSFSSFHSSSFGIIGLPS